MEYIYSLTSTVSGTNLVGIRGIRQKIIAFSQIIDCKLKRIEDKSQYHIKSSESFRDRAN